MLGTVAEETQLRFRRKLARMGELRGSWPSDSTGECKGEVGTEWVR